MKKIQISPSILSADFSQLANEIKRLEQGGADMIHVDVMDGHFVPNLTIGPPVIKRLRNCTQLPFDVHLMISPVHKYIKDYADAGADIITVHPEATENLQDTIDHIKSLKKKVGISLNPDTQLNVINNIIDQKRLVTGVQAGITRDSIEVLWNYKNEQVSIIDTAGLRKKSKVINILEKDMVNDTLRTIKFSDICILLIDVSKSIDKQDLNIARMIIGEGRGLIIGANMWDKIIDKNLIKEEIFYQL